jgi:hypothetical protein
MAFPSSKAVLSNTEQVAHSTFRIEVTTTTEVAVATGFLAEFTLPNGNKAVAMISSRHVLQGALKVRVWVPIEKRCGRLPERFADITIELDGKATFHPDLDVDLAGFIFHHIEKQVLPSDEKLFYTAISTKSIPVLEEWSDISIGDDVFVVGCPEGLEDVRNRRPLVRKGIIASFPKELERPNFLIDVPTLTGSSGSPVIIDTHISFNRPKMEYELRSRFYLVGVVSDGLELQIESTEEQGSQTLADLHLGKVVRSDKLLELIDSILFGYGIR